MPSENLDLVRSIFAAWELGDFSNTEWADPEIAFVVADGPQPGTWTGHAGMAEANRETLDAWEDVRILVDEYRELDAERMLVLIRRSARGKGSGLKIAATVRTQGAILFRINGGKVMRLVLYWDRDRALSDLGLAREADSA